jgi:hypothetical protein
MMVVQVQPFAMLFIAVAFSSGAHGLASPKRNSKVTVWDNVLSKETCGVLHDAVSASGLGHNVFY